MKRLLYILLILISANTYAQIEGTKDSVPLLNMDKNPDLKKEQLDNYLQLNNTSVISELSDVSVPNYQPLRKPDSKPIEFNLPPMYYDPFSEIFPSAISSRNPFVDDYGYSAFYGISEQAFLTTLSTQDTYPTLGAIRIMSAQFGYQPAAWLQLSGGPYVSKYNVYDGNHYNDAGVSGRMKFILNNRFRLNVYGQYSINGRSNNIGTPMVGMYPQSYYGGTVEFKMTEKLGVEAGLVRELNPFSGKWETRPVIAPVFHIK